MQNWFCHHLENFICFPLIYRFAGIRRVLTELEADNWKHRPNYTVTLIGLNIWNWGKNDFDSNVLTFSTLFYHVVDKLVQPIYLTIILRDCTEY